MTFSIEVQYKNFEQKVEAICDKIDEIEEEIKKIKQGCLG